MATYALMIKIPTERRIKVGKQGIIRFVPGAYLYIGSAQPGLGSSDCKCPSHLLRAAAPAEEIRRSLTFLGFHPSLVTI